MFQDIYLPERIAGYESTALPRANVTIVSAANESEQRTRNTLHPLRDFNFPAGVQCADDVQDLYEHWLVMGGPYHTFPLRDQLDFASRRLVKPGLAPNILGGDQVIGIGDGFNRIFQLQKKYTRGGFNYERPIYLPLVETVSLLIDAKALDDGTLPGHPYTFDVTRYGGQVIFDHAPRAGQIVTAGFLFDCEVRFANNDGYSQVLKAFQLSGFSALDFKEVRFCNDEVSG